jgi:hypothetical protein
MQEVTVQDYRIDHSTVTDAEKATYANGECGRLARALAEITGWEVCLVGFYTDDAGSETYVHVVVRMPDGRYLDVEGVHDAQALFDRWDNELSAWAEDFAAEEIEVEYDIFPAGDLERWAEMPEADDAARAVARRLLGQ